MVGLTKGHPNKENIHFTCICICTGTKYSYVIWLRRVSISCRHAYRSLDSYRHRRLGRHTKTRKLYVGIGGKHKRLSSRLGRIGNYMRLGDIEEIQKTRCM